MKRTRKQVRKDRWWNHIKQWLKAPYFINLQPALEWEPDLWRNAFERFQTHGPKALTVIELDGIQPLIAAQVQKEAVLTGHACEAMEWWASHQCWIHPLRDSIERGGYDRLTKLALLRMIQSLRKDPISFFASHPGIPEKSKARNFAQYVLECSTPNE